MQISTVEYSSSGVHEEEGKYGTAAPERSYFNRALCGVFFTSAVLNFLMFFKCSISLFLPFPPLVLVILANDLVPFLSHRWK